MTKKQIEESLATHRSQYEYAKRILAERYYELEAREDGELDRWTSIFVKHKRAIEWLEKQKPDN